MVAIDQLPQDVFWDNAAAPLQVVNEGDLRLSQLLQRIGAAKLPIKVAATSDRAEIMRRQALTAWLFENPEVQRALAEYRLNPDVSHQPGRFLHEFNPERCSSSAFMEQLQAVVEAFEASNHVPSAVESFLTELRATLQDATVTEREFANTTADYLQRAAEISGVVDFIRPAQGKDSVDTKKAIVSGYRLHCYQPLSYRRINLPVWFEDRRWLGAPVRAAAELWNRHYDRVVYGGQVIEALPKRLEEIIRLAGRHVLVNDDMQDAADWRLTFAFRYLDGELRVKLIDMQVSYTDKDGDVRIQAGRHERSKILEHRLLTDFQGYSRKQIRRLKKQARRIHVQSAHNHLARVHKSFIHNNLPDGAGEFFSEAGKLIEDAEFNGQFRNYALNGLFHEDGPVKNLYDDVTAYRSWVADRVEQLRALSTVVSKMQQVARAGDWPLTIPEVLGESEHMVRFTSLIPTQLIGQATSTGRTLDSTDLVPIQDFTKLNGELIFLTGHNAGGKTVTQETLAETLYLAQCGLPVFGAGVAFNPKEVLAVVFIERGAGSTAELLLRKIKATLATVSKSDPARTLVVLDELGTGTQEVDGDQLARQVLARLQTIGCSVLASTQIISLAEYAETDLNALMFQIDRGRHITPGIGRGDVAGLADRVGLSEFLH